MAKAKPESTKRKTAAKKTAKGGKKTAAKSPKKAAAKTAKKPAPKKRKTTKKTATGRKISPEERYNMIQTAAYFRAQKDGFAGDAMQYWVDAEKEIEGLLKK